MQFVQRLAASADLTAERLRALFIEHAPANTTRLGAAMRHAIFAGGKRFRPFLAIESAALFGLPAQAAVDTAAAFECVHCYSLAHDDLPCMDDDDMRRGEPSLHKAFDEWTAILAGDALLTLAFEIVSLPSTHHDAHVRSALVAALAKAAGGTGMVAGQMLDLAAEKRAEPPRPTLDHVLRLQALKTGALIACACEAGAILASAPILERAALRRYGEQLGLVFQIADDFLDAHGDAGTVGKATGKDDAAGKATLVGLLGADRAKTRLAEAERDAVEALSPFGARASVLIEAVRFAASRAH